MNIFFGNIKEWFNKKEAKMNETIVLSSLSISGSEEKKSISEESIRETAYYLWEAAGKPSGDGSEFWIEAEKQLQNS